MVKEGALWLWAMWEAQLFCGRICTNRSLCSNLQKLVYGLEGQRGWRGGWRLEESSNGDNVEAEYQRGVKRQRRWRHQGESKQWRQIANGRREGRRGGQRGRVLTKNQRATAMLCPKDGDQTAAGCTNGVDDVLFPEDGNGTKGAYKRVRGVGRREGREEVVMVLVKEDGRGGEKGAFEVGTLARLASATATTRSSNPRSESALPFLGLLLPF
ncbi:hypothetical protein BKA61DRAFT_575085 [Leptodontidium sp. MPI-SDFR-AT-0119]|nr:hypothetical protein BKA61DRAFT_575085 [Leptodontidium sp. MPI-SDFR-AT-0119]